MRFPALLPPAAVLAALLFMHGEPVAQVPPELREPLRAIGPVINPPATATLYSDRHTPAEKITTVKRDLTYGPDPRHRLDVFGAANAGAKPVLLFVHGGAFVAGDKKLSPTSPFYDNVGAWAARNGMLGVTMTYRLAPQYPWPAGPEDIGRAIAWLRGNAKSLGGDPELIFLFGHSAGASHAAAYVAHPEFHPAPGGGIAAALLLSGVYRIDAALVAQSPTYPSYFGSDPSRYTERSSFDGLLKSAVPLWIAASELDPPSFRTQFENLRAGLEKAGRPFSWMEFDGHSHMSEAYSINTSLDPVGDAMLGFIKSLRN